MQEGRDPQNNDEPSGAERLAQHDQIYVSLMVWRCIVSNKNQVDTTAAW